MKKKSHELPSLSCIKFKNYFSYTKASSSFKFYNCVTVTYVALELECLVTLKEPHTEKRLKQSLDKILVKVQWRNNGMGHCPHTPKLRPTEEGLLHPHTLHTPPTHPFSPLMELPCSNTLPWY